MFQTSFVLLIIIIAVIVFLSKQIRIVPQQNCYVIERLGKYNTIWYAGLHIKVPIIDKVVRKISLKEHVLDFPPQNVITQDNVTMGIDSVVYAKVFDPEKYTYGIEDPILGLQNLTATTLRSIIGSMELDQTLSSRAEINAQMQLILDEATDQWGLKVSRVEVKPPRLNCCAIIDGASLPHRGFCVLRLALCPAATLDGAGCLTNRYS